MEKVVNQSDLFQKYVANRPISAWKAFQLYKDDFVKIIPAHWLKFEPVNNVPFIFSAGINSLLTVHGLFVIIPLIAKILSWKSRRPINYLLLNLVFCDLLNMIKNFLLIFNSVFRGPALGELGIRIDGLLGGLSDIGSILTLLAVEAEAHSTISFGSGLKLPGVSIVILGIWIIACLFSMIPFFGVFGIQFKADGLLTAATFDYWQKDYNNRLFILVLMMARFLLPFGFFWNTYKDMWTHVSDYGGRARNDSDPGEIYNEEQEMSTLSQKISKMEEQIENVEKDIEDIEQCIAEMIPQVWISRRKLAKVKRKVLNVTQQISNVKHNISQLDAQISELKKKIEETYKPYGTLALKLVVVWLVTSIPFEIISVVQVLGYEKHVTPLLFALATQWSQLRNNISPFLIKTNLPKID